MNHAIAIKSPGGKLFAQHPLVAALCPERPKNILRAQWLRPPLNFFAARYHIKMAALTPFHEYTHLKMLPTWQMMMEDYCAGRYQGVHAIHVDSSGNTAHAVVRLARALGFREAHVYMASDVPAAKSDLIRAIGGYVTVHHVSGGKSVAQAAAEAGSAPGHYHLNQYAHQGNVNAHRRYTGPEVRRLLGTDVKVIAVAGGSGGTVKGIGDFFKIDAKEYAQPTVVCVNPKLGEQVPGARDRRKMAEVSKFDLSTAVDAFVEVSRRDSFKGARMLWRDVEPQPGPTSGMAWRGLEQYLDGLGHERLAAMEGGTVGFICHDDMRPYTGLFMSELDPEEGVV